MCRFAWLDDTYALFDVYEGNWGVAGLVGTNVGSARRCGWAIEECCLHNGGSRQSLRISPNDVNQPSTSDRSSTLGARMRTTPLCFTVAIATFAAAPPLVFAQPQQQWVRFYEGGINGPDQFRDLAVANNGVFRFAVLGRS